MLLVSYKQFVDLRGEQAMRHSLYACSRSKSSQAKNDQTNPAKQFCANPGQEHALANNIRTGALTLVDFSGSSVITTHVDLVNHTWPLDRGQEYRICELFQAAQ